MTTKTLSGNKKIYFPRFLEKNGRGIADHRKLFAINNLWIKWVIYGSRWVSLGNFIIWQIDTKTNLRTRISHNFPYEGFSMSQKFPFCGIYICPNNNPLMRFYCLSNSPGLYWDSTLPNNSPILGSICPKNSPMLGKTWETFPNRAGLTRICMENHASVTGW